jgi:hypothetical protein
MQDAIPTHIRHFLRDHIRSVVQLELLLMMHKEPERAWKIDEAGEQLYIPGSFAGPLLESLRAAGLVAVTDENGPRYRFAPQAAHLGPLVDELAAVYQERPVSTIHAIYTGPADNLQQFADAFRIRKKEES